MPLDNQVLNMTPGEALLDVPMADIVERMGRAISQAQVRLDQASIQTAIELGESRLDLHDAGGALISRSLLELGFLPTFYQFTETTIDISVTLSIRVEESFHVGGTASFNTSTTSGTGGTGTSTSPIGSTGLAGPSGPSGPGGSTPSIPGAAPLGQAISSSNFSTRDATMFGLTISADYHRRYDFNTTAASRVTTKMLAVPPPPAFLQALRENFGIGA